MAKLENVENTVLYLNNSDIYGADFSDVVTATGGTLSSVAWSVVWGDDFVTATNAGVNGNIGRGLVSSNSKEGVALVEAVGTLDNGVIKSQFFKVETKLPKPGDFR